jgi:membrane-associated phospholipid phosphatase
MAEGRKRMGRIVVLALACALASAPALAGTDSTIEQAGVDVAIALPVVAGTISVLKDDWNGVGELVLDTGATVGTALALKHLIHEERPDGSNDQSFPSDTAALAFAPAQYLWDRYGWEYGLPAYAAAGFVGYSRVESKQHHWWDVATSAGIAFGYSKWITTRYHPSRDFETSLSATPNSAYLTMSYRF